MEIDIYREERKVSRKTIRSPHRNGGNALSCEDGSRSFRTRRRRCFS